MCRNKLIQEQVPKENPSKKKNREEIVKAFFQNLSAFITNLLIKNKPEQKENELLSNKEKINNSNFSRKKVLFFVIMI